MGIGVSIHGNKFKILLFLFYIVKWHIISHRTPQYHRDKIISNTYERKAGCQKVFTVLSLFFENTENLIERKNKALSIIITLGRKSSNKNFVFQFLEFLNN
jgi:hypothetical protein